MDQYELLALFLRRKWILIGVFAATVLAHGFILQWQPEYYAAEALVQLRTHEPGKISVGAMDGLEIYEAFDLPLLKQLVRDRKFHDRVQDLLHAAGHAQLAAHWDRDAFTVKPDAENRFLIARYESAAKAEVNPVLDAALAAATQVAQEHFEQGIARGRERLSARAAGLDAELERIEADLTQLRDAAGLPPGTEGGAVRREALLATIEALDRKTVELEGEAAELRRRIAANAATAAAEGAAPLDEQKLLAALEGTPVYSVIRDLAVELMRDEVALIQETAIKTDLHPDIQRLVTELEHERRILSAALDEDSPLYPRVQHALRVCAGREEQARAIVAAELAATGDKLERLLALREKKEELLLGLQRHEGDIRALEERKSALLESRKSLDVNLGRLEMFANLAPAIVQVFRAPAAARSVGKKLSSYLPLMAAAGFVLALGAVFGLETFDHRIHNQHILRRHSQLALLGTVPSLRVAEHEGALFAQSAECTEAFNAILKKILVQLGDGKSVLITGPGIGVGKSFVACNLALCAARLGVKTLLIDADLRQPSAARTLGAERSPGIVEWLEGGEELRVAALDASLERAALGAGSVRLRPYELPAPAAGAARISLLLGPRPLHAFAQETAQQNLFLLPSGAQTDRAAALLESEAMTQLLAWARKEFQLVIVDTPPLSVVADALLLAGKVDTCAVVVRAGQTRSQDLHWARESLGDIGAPVVGCVLNALPTRLPGYYSYYEGRKYYRERV
ncbi:MAG: AAA family ATPase [Planctomycetes bacterium]|nr:AAA family ATPase [Planctomycetota bacterium]